MNKRWEGVVKSVKRETFLSVSNVAVMTVTFLVLGVFVGVMGLSRTGLSKLQEQAQVTIFFNDDFAEEKILDLKASLEADPRILHIAYVSKEDAFNLFTEMNKDDPILLESISSNILPASLEIKSGDLSDLPVLAQEFEELDGVEEVKFFKDVIENFRRLSNLLILVGLIMVGIFLIISYAVIMVTLRITVSSKGTEFSIMKLVGATDKYIKKPLVFQSMFFSVSAAVLASILLVILFIILNSVHLLGLETLISFTLFSTIKIGLTSFLLGLVFILVVSGFLLGYLGSLTAVKKYLKY